MEDFLDGRTKNGIIPSALSLILFFFDLFSIYFAIFIRGMEEDILEWKIYGDIYGGIYNGRFIS